MKENSQMKLAFKVDAVALNAAIEVVSIVPPRPMDKQGSCGYLLRIQGETGYIYSQDGQHVARAQFPISEVEGEGVFVYPSAFIGSFASFTTGTVSFEAKEEGGKFSVRYSAMDGKAWEDRPSFDPAGLRTIEKDLEKVTERRTFSVPLLREAISQSRAFTEAKESRAEEKHKTIQIFDAKVEVDDPKNPGQKIRPCEKGDGTLFATNGTQAFFFYTEAFLGKHLSVHSAHMPMLQSFLTRAVGSIDIGVGVNTTFATDSQGNVFGWTHSASAATPQKYAYYSLSTDTHVAKVACGSMTGALKHVRKMLDAKCEKIRMTLDTKASQILFEVNEGTGSGRCWPVDVDIIQGADKDSFTLNVNVSHFIDLFSGCKGNTVDLRMVFMPADGTSKRPKDQGFFRTIDEFSLDENGKVTDAKTEVKVEGAVVCKTTRFTSSMN
jgi:hypothetical protein